MLKPVIVSRTVCCDIFGVCYTIGQKFGITPLKQTLWYESTRNGQAKMPLGRIGAPFIYASDKHNTFTVHKTVQELEAEN